MKNHLGFFGSSGPEADERNLNALSGARRAADHRNFCGGHRRLARRVRANAEGFA
jgi:hypothetical protein